MSGRLALSLSLAAAALAAAGAGNRIQLSYCFEPGEAAGGGVLNTERNRVYCLTDGSRSYDSGSVSDSSGDVCRIYSLPPAGMKVSYWLSGQQLDVYNDAESARTASGESEYSVQYSSQYSATRPLYVGARFGYISYGIKFAANGGGGNMSALSGIVYTDTVALPANAFAKLGYTFAGWKDSAGRSFSDGQTVGGSDLGVADDGTNVTLTAQWTASTYTVAFDANGGTTPTMSKRVIYASTYGALPTATRTGYGFSGWYTRASGGTRVTEETKVTETADHAIYAHWRANTYTVTLDRQGGSGGTASVTATYGQLSPTVTVPTRAGYAFGGYWTAKNGGGQYFGADGKATRTWNNTKTYTLYAKWTANTYTVALDRQGGAGGTNVVTTTYGQLSPTVTVPTRAGYAFGGYWTAKNGGGQYFGADGKATRTWNNTKTYTLYAKWTANKYTAFFNANGSGATVSPASKQVTYGSAYGELPAPTRTGYAFVKWVNAGVEISASTVVEKAQNHTLYAQWKANTYTVTLDKQGGSGGTSSMTATYGQTPSAVTPPTFAGHTFGGYWTAKNGGGGQYFGADGRATRTWNNTKTYTLYAKWSANAYAVSLDANNGVLPEGAANPMSVTYGNQYGTLPVPTRTGYDFLGWWTQDNGGSEVTNAMVVSTAKDHTLYAHWNPKAYTVFFNANGSGATVSPASKQVTYDSAYGELPVPARTGYTFAKWVNAGSEIKRNTIVKKAQNHTLYAQWTAGTYAVTLDKQGGSGGTAAVTAVYGQMPPDVDAPTRVGYAFGGYWTAKDGGGVQYIGADGKATRTWNNTKTYALYAKWTANTYTVTLDKQGGSGGADAVTTTYGQPSPTVDAPTRTGYAFGGYWTAKDGGGGQYVGADGKATRTWNNTKTYTLYAKWTANTYTVSFDAGGGSGKMPDQVFTYDEAQALSACSFDPPSPGAEFRGFVGWSNVVDNVAYEPSEIVSNLTAEAGGSVALVAVWGDIRTDLSKAMHCLNLNWNSDKPDALNPDCGYWGAAHAAGIGYESDSCVTNVNKSNAYLYTDVATNGTLTFYSKCAGGAGNTVTLRCRHGATVGAGTVTNVTVTTDWQLVSLDIEKPGSVTLETYQGYSVVYIDQMTWKPASKTKPSKKDARDISGISFSGGTLSLTFTNADERFDYQLRGTNDPSVARSLWPVLWTTNGVGTITIEPPVDSEGRKMFYYLQTIGK